MAEPEFVGRVKVPAPDTLKKYGLTRADWDELLEAAGGACWVCGNVSPSGILHIDHFHVRGFKVMAPATKKLYVRGLLCWMDNSVLLRRGVTPQRLRSAAEYLERFEERNPQNVSSPVARRTPKAAAVASAKKKTPRTRANTGPRSRSPLNRKSGSGDGE